MSGEAVVSTSADTPQTTDLMARLESPIANSFSPEQKDALARAFAPGWNRHPVNIRVSMPWVGGRFYLTLIGGKERRDTHRRTLERQRHPVATIGNFFFVIGLGAIFYIGAIMAVAVQSSIIEF